jgi:hypothetical protein
VRRRGHSAVAVAVVGAVVAAGCGTRGGGNGLSAQAAKFDAVIHRAGATLHATGQNCSGLYGAWTVRLSVSGRAKGSGTTGFTLVRGREATAPVSFKIRAGILSGRATGVLHVRGRPNALLVNGSVEVKVPFLHRTATIGETIPVTRGPAPGCGLSG